MNNKLLFSIGAAIIVSGLVYHTFGEKTEESAVQEVSIGSNNKNNLPEDLSVEVGEASLSQERNSAQENEGNNTGLEGEEELTDKELANFAIKKITEIDFGLRPDRYSIEQLAIIGKYIKGMPLTREELEINLTYFLDIALRVENENPGGPVGGIDFEGKKEWVDAHAYNEGFKYWNSLVEDGDAQAARLLGRYYSTAGYTNDAISTYKYILPHLKTQKDKGYITYQLANELKEKEPFIAAVYYWLSISDFNSNLTNGKLQNIVEQYDARQLQEQINAIKMSANWHTTDD